ncbi:hypothetical protein AUL39_01815 [Tractidigestivibacter scatoligenes]|uniref:Uncharacterized protein n=1 Tax=Tractidigestivibacter scatoligenes TaxID=1299998 RepID=A0A100YWR1_TRASO|nr:chloride channel protein [Tractidigestivibacter scatoligenes]KUH59093.1 hypothetical protein AUL39_01815 [Tractidigestivibacter scatoligenes]
MQNEKPKTHERIIDAAEEAPRGVALLRASLVLLLWAMAAVGFVIGALGVSRLFGPGAGFPRFDGIDYLGLDARAMWAFLALPLGWVLARLAELAGRAAKLTCGRMKTVPEAILCGIVLGLVAMALPEVLFSGQSGTWDLLSGWQAMGAGMLLATCVAKLALTQLCEETGWIGGEFFPPSSAGSPLATPSQSSPGATPCSRWRSPRVPSWELARESGCSAPACLRCASHR